MPYSDGTLRPWTLKTLTAHTDPATWARVIDVGAGAGNWLEALRPATPDARWAAVEVWAPYIAQFGLASRYDDVIVADVRHLAMPDADLWILGDVLEHMPQPDAVSVWHRARAHARWLIAALPVCVYPQGPWYGNPYEAHVHHWTETEVLGQLPGIIAHATTGQTPETGVFIAKGDL